jgi:hypothetical protein
MLDDLNLPDYNVLGYKITKQVVEDHYIKAYPIPPEKLITAQSYIGDSLPSNEFIYWGSQKTEYRGDFIQIEIYNIERSQLANMVNYITDQFKKGYIGWVDFCTSLYSAKNLCRKFIPRSSNPVIIGFGLTPNNFRELFNPDKPHWWNKGTEVLINYKKDRRMMGGGTVLGWEPCGFDTPNGEPESWLFFDGLIRTISSMIEIKTNRYGLIEDYSIAKKICEYCMLDESGTHGGVWAPILVVEYPLEGKDEGEDEAAKIAKQLVDFRIKNMG